MSRAPHHAARPRRCDVLIVGGGPAGLSAALFLGRCRRSVVVVDDEHPRNAGTATTHGFFTRDGTTPEELRRLGREQLAPYDVTLLDARVRDVSAMRGGFRALLEDGRLFHARKVVLATGLVDELPAIEGLDALWGKSVFHCPVCDAWEFRDRALAVHGRGAAAVELALALSTWSKDVVLCSDGWTRLDVGQRRTLAAHGMQIRTEPIARLEGDDRGMLRRIVFVRGQPLDRDALFCQMPTRQRADLGLRLGVELGSKGAVRCGPDMSTCVPGVYVAGDAAEDAHFIGNAVAHGTKVAFVLNRALRNEATRALLAPRDGRLLGERAHR